MLSAAVVISALRVKYFIFCCTEPFIITLPLSRYDLNNVERDIKQQNNIIILFDMFISGLTQIRIDSDDRTLFAIGMIDHFEKLKKEINECHVILRGMATRVKERLKIFGTMPASEVSVSSI